jgi:CHASE2 domain-containing sensor protein
MSSQSPVPRTRVQVSSQAPMSPLARSVGACAACMTVGLLICAATYILRGVDFGPLRSLVSFEDQVYNKVVPPTVDLKSGFRPIIFIDIDDSAIEQWETVSDKSEATERSQIPRPTQVQGAAGGTPRALIAQLVHILRQAGTSVIFLDLDFRNELPNDSVLRKELVAKNSATSILLPVFLGPGVLPACEAQTDDKPLIEQEIVFDDTMGEGRVATVHSVAALGFYGQVEGTCSFYRARDKGKPVSRMAAMLRATGAYSADDLGTPRLRSTRWWIRNDTDLLYDKTTHRLAYARVKASLYTSKHTVDMTGADLSGFKNAIAIIGSTHRWSDDYHATPVGDLPGAVVHANLGIEFQSPPPAKDVPWQFQFIVDAVLVIASALLTIPLCWLPLYKQIPPGARLTTRKRMFRLTREGLIIAIFGLALSVLYLVASSFGNVLAGWRFGMLIFFLSALVVLMIELIAALAEGASVGAEALTMRLSRRRPPSSTERQT